MNTKELTKREQEEVEREVKTEFKKPSLHNVLMHNDDFTPMEFVVAILETFFGMERAKAVSVMFEVHTIGQAICGTYSKDVADTKIDQVMEYARRHDHPLQCSVEAL